MTTFPLLGGRLLLEDTEPRPSEDPLWLAATMPILSAGSRVLDAACGCGIAGLALLRHQPSLNLEAQDISAACTALALRNAALNHIPLTVHTADLLITEPAPQPYDAILCNPPFYGEENGHTSPNLHKKQARCLPAGHLTLWLKALASHLSPSGLLHLVLHTDCEAELTAFAKHTYALTLTPLQTHVKKPPKRLLATLRATINPSLTRLPLLEAHNPQTRQSHLF